MEQPGTEEQDSRDMAQLISGKDSALNDLMQRHSQRVFQYLYRALQNYEDAADLAQETFVRVYENRSRFDTSKKFTTWLYVIATNLVRDRIRWRERHPQVSLDAEAASSESSLKETLAASKPHPDQELEATERSNAVRVAIGSLPESMRVPLVLAAYEGLSHNEIAGVLNCTAKAVENRVARARQALREKLTQYFPQM